MSHCLLRRTSRLVEPHCSLVLWVAEPYSSGPGTIDLRNVSWTVREGTHIRPWPPDFVRVVSSAQPEKVLTVRDQRCESVDLNKKNILAYVSATLCAISLNACNYNMELSSAEYTNIARLLCLIFWPIRHWTYINVSLCKGIPAAPSSCGSMTLDFHLYISWFLGIYTIWIPGHRKPSWDPTFLGLCHLTAGLRCSRFLINDVSLWIWTKRTYLHTSLPLCVNISVYMYVMEWMHVITTWNCHQLSTQTLRGCCAGFSGRSDTEHVNVNLCTGIPAAHSELWEYEFGFSFLHIMVSGNIHNLNTLWSRNKSWVHEELINIEVIVNVSLHDRPWTCTLHFLLLHPTRCVQRDASNACDQYEYDWHATDLRI